MLKSRRSLSSLSVPTGAILCGWFILQKQQGARGQGPGWAPQGMGLWYQPWRICERLACKSLCLSLEKLAVSFH